MGESANVKLQEAFQKITPEFIDNLNAVFNSEICPSRKGYENLEQFISELKTINYEKVWHAARLIYALALEAANSDSLFD